MDSNPGLPDLVPGLDPGIFRKARPNNPDPSGRNKTLLLSTEKVLCVSGIEAICDPVVYTPDRTTFTHQVYNFCASGCTPVKWGLLLCYFLQSILKYTRPGSTLIPSFPKVLLLSAYQETSPWIHTLTFSHFYLVSGEPGMGANEDVSCTTQALKGVYAAWEAMTGKSEHQPRKSPRGNILATR